MSSTPPTPDLASNASAISAMLSALAAILSLILGLWSFSAANKSELALREAQKAIAEQEKSHMEREEIHWNLIEFSYKLQAEQIEQDLYPRIQQVGQFSFDPKNSHRTEIQFRNLSSRASASISYITFVVSNPAILAEIESVYPKPSMTTPCPPPLKANEGAEIDLRTSNGCWGDGKAFTVAATVSMSIEPARTLPIRLRIRDPRLQGKTLYGEITLIYDNNRLASTNRSIGIIVVP